MLQAAGKKIDILPSVFEADETDSGISWPATPMVSDKVKELGGEVEEVGVEEFIIDQENKLFTTPAFMCEGAAFHQVIIAKRFCKESTLRGR